MNYQSDQGKLTAQEGWLKTVSTVLARVATLIGALIGANHLFELVQANTTFYLVLSAALLYGAGCVRLFYYLFSKHSKRESYRFWKKALFVTFCLIIPVAGYFWTHDDDSVNSEGFRVLVANLDGPDAKFGLTQKILSRLRSRASAYDSVEVVALDSVIAEQQGGDKARKEGRNKEADLVLWGRYRTFSASSDSASAVVNAEIMGEEYVPGISAPAEPTYHSLSSPRNFRVKVAGDTESLILLTLAYAQYETASYEEAIELYTEALSQNGRLANSEMDAYLFRGLAHLRSGESDEAFEDFDHIVEVKPSYTGAWLNRGRALAQQGRHPEAIESYDQALAIDSSFFMAWANRGNVLGNPEAAKKSYRRAIRIDSSEAGVWHNLGLVFIKQDSSQKAIESFDKALAIDSSLAVSWYSRGNAIRQKGNLVVGFLCVGENRPLWPLRAQFYSGPPLFHSENRLF